MSRNNLPFSRQTEEESIPVSEEGIPVSEETELSHGRSGVACHIKRLDVIQLRIQYLRWASHPLSIFLIQCEGPEPHKGA